MTMRILPSGPRARLIEHDDPLGFAAGLRDAAATGRIDGLIDVVPAETTVLATFDRTPSDDVLARVTASPSSVGDSSEITLPVYYDGADLHEVAHLSGLSVDGVIAAHAEASYRVAFCGFAPGFAYLTGTDARLHLPRRDTPRTRVPAGSVAIAAGYSAVYPLSSPGGWHLIGRTDTIIFDATRSEPALLRPGMRVRFSRDAAIRPAAMDSTPRPDHRTADPVLEVIDPGPLTLVQDLGRHGYGDIAVGESGAFDRTAHRLANRIVGNAESAAALEALGGGLAMRALRHCVVAVTGAEGAVLVDGAPSDRGAPLHLGPDQVLTLGAPAAGIRSVVAVRGGIAGAAILGSLSRDTLAGLGPDPLAPGSLIGVGEPSSALLVDHVPSAAVAPAITLALHPGPRRDRLAPKGRRTFSESTFTVGADSDRIGIRLDGPGLELRGEGPRASEGVVRGAVQVPPDGRPVILGPDHPVTGGYPVVGVVDDIDSLAQAAPGTPVRFTLVGW